MIEDFWSSSFFIWIIFQFYFILVNVQRVYDIVTTKRLGKNTGLPKVTQQMLFICPQKNKRQLRTPAIDRWYKKEDKKRTRSSEYPSILKSGGKGGPKMSAVSWIWMAE